MTFYLKRTHMIYCFDLDNTICHTDGNNYKTSIPDKGMIDRVNSLYNIGHTIIIYTARGMTTYKGNIHDVYNNLFNLTKDQIDNWGIKYHQLNMAKPSYDVFIDDKNLSIQEFKKSFNPIKGFIAGCFDIIHPGYIKMFKESKENCDRLIIGLHNDPSIERNTKLKPILSILERKEILESIKYIDDIIVYNTEEDLIHLIKKLNVDVLFLGDDYKEKENNGTKLNIKTIYINRDHGWSSSKLKKEIKNV